MKNLYVVYSNKKGKIIAYHKDKEVCEMYINGLDDDDDYLIMKVKKEDIVDTDIVLSDDDYLVRYKDNYVQKKYLEYVDIMTDEFFYDGRITIDTLYKMCLDENLSKKERKILKKAKKIIDEAYQFERMKSYSADMLESVKEFYRPYIENIKEIENDKR